MGLTENKNLIAEKWILFREWAGN